MTNALEQAIQQNMEMKSRPPQMTCHACSLLGILPANQRSTLIAALDAGVETTVLSKALRDIGYDISVHSLRRHRNQEHSV